MSIKQYLLNSTSAQYILRSYPRGSQFPAPIAYSCNVPTRTVTVGQTGDCFLCSCDGWLPITVGKITDFEQLEDIWTSATAVELQQDINDKKFTYCAVNHCGIVNNNISVEKYDINVNIDESCNLACPSCRRAQKNHTSGALFDRKKNYVDHFVDLIDKFDKPLQLTMSGNGDPLASLIMRPLVLNWLPKANQTIVIRTNGLLMKKLLPDSTIFPSIQKFQISVDAGSESVYEIVRRPGRFSVLQENLQWLSDNKIPGTSVSLFFCLSASNASDLINFADMCGKFGFDGFISKLDDWNTFDKFADHDVIGNVDHPLRSTALEQLRTVAARPRIYLSPYLLNFL